jgi:predicted aspartyl protease
MHSIHRVLSLTLFSLAILHMSGTSLAQELVHTIRATSKTITILDGDDELTGLIAPELDLDVYVYHPSSHPKTVSIITDVDRLDVIVEPGRSYDFTIDFGGKTCLQRLSPVHPDGVIYRSKQEGGTADSIPFTLGPNHAIHFNGSINKSKQLDLIFDTGASVCVLSDEGQAKGVRIIQGPRNQIELNDMTIDHSEMVYIDYRGKLRADGVVGYNAFPGKVVHIDYERGLLSVSDQLPELKGFVKSDLVWRGAGTFVPITLHHGVSTSTTLALFDTGSRWSLSLVDDEAFSRQNFLTVEEQGWRTGVTADGTRISSKVFTLDRLTIAGLTFNHVQAELERPSKRPGLTFNILGNDFLRRVNLAIDYRNSVVYLKQNCFANANYNSVVDLKSTMLTGILAIGITVAGVVYWKRRANRSSRHWSNRRRTY